MNVKHFLNTLEHQRIHEAILAAETGSSGRIVLSISHRKVTDPLAAAHREFLKRKLETDTEKNNLLIFLAPATRKMAVVGGTALHEKVGQAWWDDFVARLTRSFQEGRYTEGLIAALDHAGHALKTRFPAALPDRTGRPDIVEE